MNGVPRIALRSVAPLAPPADDDKPSTSIPTRPSGRVTKKLVDWAATDLPNELEKLNEEIAATIGNAVDTLRIACEPSQPLSMALMRARWLAASMSDRATLHGLALAVPHVTTTANEEVMLEWWRAERKLTFYVTGAAVEYVRVWGADILNEMDDGVLDVPPTNFVHVWRWLLDGG
jgi:hypothetical protein